MERKFSSVTVSAIVFWVGGLCSGTREALLCCGSVGESHCERWLTTSFVVRKAHIHKEWHGIEIFLLIAYALSALMLGYSRAMTT